MTKEQRKAIDDMWRTLDYIGNLEEVGFKRFPVGVRQKATKARDAWTKANAAPITDKPYPPTVKPCNCAGCGGEGVPPMRAFDVCENPLCDNYAVAYRVDKGHTCTPITPGPELVPAPGAAFDFEDNLPF